MPFCVCHAMRFCPSPRVSVSGSGQSASVVCGASPPLPMVVRRTSGYGYRQRPSSVRWHEGIDLGAREGTPVYAILNGTVAHAVTAGTPHFGGYGNCVVVAHDGGLWSLYAHMREPPLVERGQPVAAGAQLGKVGGTSDSQAQTIPVHLHLSIAVRAWPKHYDEASVNPELILGSLGLLFDPPGLVPSRLPGMPVLNPTTEQKVGRMGARSGRARIEPGSRLTCAPPESAVVPVLPLPAVLPEATPLATTPEPAPRRDLPTRDLRPDAGRASAVVGPALLVLGGFAALFVLTKGAKRALAAAA